MSQRKMTDAKTAPLAVTPAPSPDLSPAAPPALKSVRQRVPRKVRECIDLIAFGHVDTKAAAARKIGISREYLARSYQNPAVAQYSTEAARRAIAMGSPRAAAVLNELADSASSERVQMEAASRVLANNGIKPPADAQVNVNIEMKAGYVIDLSEPDEPRFSDAQALAKAIGEPVRAIDLSVPGNSPDAIKPIDAKPAE